jgi:hypothetical protein
MHPRHVLLIISYDLLGDALQFTSNHRRPQKRHQPTFPASHLRSSKMDSVLIHRTGDAKRNKTGRIAGDRLEECEELDISRV